MDQQELERIRYEMQYGKPHGVEMNCTINVLLDEVRDWKPESVSAFMGGIAKVIAVENEARKIGE